MNTTIITTTAVQPASACGRAFGMPTPAFGSLIGADVKVRDAHVTAALVGAYPGTPVWRPPSC